jgi:hypothetical protein
MLPQLFHPRPQKRSNLSALATATALPYLTGVVRLLPSQASKNPAGICTSTWKLVHASGTVKRRTNGVSAA